MQGLDASKSEVVEETEEVETVIVRFSVVFVTKPGQNLVLLGGHPKLGNWVEHQAVRMSWTEGHLWTAEVELPCSSAYFYKYAIQEGGR